MPYRISRLGLGEIRTSDLGHYYWQELNQSFRKQYR
jgi:hypothetical protein